MNGSKRHTRADIYGKCCNAQHQYNMLAELSLPSFKSCYTAVTLSFSLHQMQKSTNNLFLHQ